MSLLSKTVDYICCNWTLSELRLLLEIAINACGIWGCVEKEGMLKSCNFG